jgi:hypothetical protein
MRKQKSLSRHRVTLRPSGFFILRTPLLPLETLASLYSKEGMSALAAQKHVAAAIASASPSLSAALTEEGSRQLASCDALARYLTRMASRCTPFGLLAGYSVGTIGSRTRIEVVSAPQTTARAYLDERQLGGMPRLLLNFV